MVEDVVVEVEVLDSVIGMVHVLHITGHIIRIISLIISSPAHWSSVRMYIPQIGNSGVPWQSLGLYNVDVDVDVEVEVGVVVVSTHVPHITWHTPWTMAPPVSHSMKVWSWLPLLAI